ncbi:STAS domain-containing protein [Streptomyces sp. SCA3-4]|uniref:STAS domain-containing protein n=1 Tax=Streptomyces sichuanensis TaxID=2871810 RepID=UPI001CE38054|nr:STAS domain-containing protein [Streptomyces sichuanensis]MCA6091119.1 STAS domain-containing protein [Streptomyces sichuanensis]
MHSDREKTSGERFHVSSTTVNGRTTVPVAGEVDYLTSSRLSDELASAVASGAQCVDVDFSRVSFCDCSGLNALLSASEYARDEGIGFSVSGPVAPAVERLLKATGAAVGLP